MQDHSSEQRLPRKRLFVAIGLPSELLLKLDKVQSELKPFAGNAKWVKPQGIHLTLKFLGYVDQNRISEIIDQLSKISQRAFDVDVSGYGFFPNARRPSVLWVGIQSTGLLDLQQKVEEVLNRLGFEKENRAFSPHLTLARFKSHEALLPLVKAVEDRKESELGNFTVKHFELFESILHRDGAEYIIVKNHPLKGKQ